MWRLGVAEEKGRAAKPKRKERTKETHVKEKMGTSSERRGSMRMIAPVLDLHGQHVNSRDRRGSIIAAEHLMMRRSSRGSKQFNQAEFAAFSNRDILAAGAIPLDHLRSNLKGRRRSSVACRMNKVKEIQDRIEKVVTDYEMSPDDETTDEGHLLHEIEDNLHMIEDDMLRINVGLLMEKFRKVSQQIKDDVYWEDRDDSDRKKELLESLQTWMDEDHFDDIDDAEPTTDVPMSDTKTMSTYLDHVQENVQKVAKLKEKIDQFKEYGTDTDHLERQKHNLEKQVKQDVLDNEYKRRNSKGPDAKKQEFHYLKNAATEIYDLLHRTRMEGMAHSHQFEEQLQKILKQMEEKDKDIEYLETRLEQQKRLVHRWCDDYEKLQNDHMLTKDEVINERKNNRKLSMEIESFKKKCQETEKHKNGSIAKIDHDKTVKEYEQHIQTLKQKVEVVTWTLKEKDTTFEDQHRQIQQLKSALRKGSSVHHGTESLYKPVENAKTGKRDTATPNNTGSGAKVEAPNPSPSPNITSAKESESLKMRVATLEKENRQLKLKKKQPDIKKDKKQNQVKTKTSFQQTDQIPETPKPPTPPMVPVVTIETTATQVFPVPALQFMSAKEKRSLYNVAQKMTQQFGKEWTEAALLLTRLQADDISELDHGLSCEEDFIRMCSGSPTKRRPTIQEPQEGDQNQVDELQEAREDLLACRVSNSVQLLTEGMLSGRDPQLLEEKNVAGINALHCELEGMVKKISGFVNKVQAFIGCQTGMMNEANETIKKSLPTNILNKLDKIKLKQGETSQMNLSCSEHSQEWKDMAATEKIRCKLKLIEESLCGMVNETMNVFINEVAKQHAEYSDIHTSVKEDDKLEVERLINDPELVRRDIQNKVESSVRYMARVTRAERGTMQYSPQRQGMGEGLMDLGGRQAGTWTGSTGPRMLKVYHSQAINGQAALTLFGHGAVDGGVSYKLPPKKLTLGKTKPSTPDNTSVRMTRQPARDLHLLRLRRSKLKSEMAKTRGLGMVVKNAQGQKEAPGIVPSPQTASIVMNKINPVYASNLPKVHSYQESRPSSKQGSNERKRGNTGITLFDLQNQLNEQLTMPKQLNVQKSVIDRTTSMPVNPQSPTERKLLITHLAPGVSPITSPQLLRRDLKLPKIS